MKAVDDGLDTIRSRFAARWEPRVRCGEGWAPLITELDRAIAAVDPEVRYVQVKEKQGELCVFTAPPATGQVKELINAAAARAATTCENCGADGQMCQKFGWTHILCAACAARDGYSPK